MADPCPVERGWPGQKLGLFAGIPLRRYNATMNIVEQLRREARRAGVTVYRVSKDSGLRVSAVQKWASGGGLNVTTAEKLARVLGFTLELVPHKKREK